MIHLGVNLTPIINKEVVSLDNLKGRSFAVDAFVVLHQFLALIRMRDGRPLTGPGGEVTSHLVGLVFRTTRLISDFGMRFIFVFDGKPPTLKANELVKRQEIREKAERQYKTSISAGDYDLAISKAVMTGRLTVNGVEDSKRLLTLLGIPWIQAPSEGEAQAAHLARKGDVWAVNSQDYDSLLYGATRLVRYITIQGEEWLPSKGISRKLRPEIIELNAVLKTLDLTREQLIDLSILIGTDYNPGIRGIGPKTALKLIRKHGRLENLPNEITMRLPSEISDIRRIFLEPDVTDVYSLRDGEFREEELIEFLCVEKGFSRDRVDTVIKRMRRAQSVRTLGDWMAVS
jgi:flap endonuclease-1